jgi:hypothetical protein
VCSARRSSFCPSRFGFDYAKKDILCFRLGFSMCSAGRALVIVKTSIAVHGLVTLVMYFHFEECRLMGCDVVRVLEELMFQRNVSPASSG